MRQFALLFYSASALSLVPTTPNNESLPLVLLTHRKAGEVLVHDLMTLVGQKYEEEIYNQEIHKTETLQKSECAEHNLIQLEDVTPKLLEDLQSTCPSFRAIHTTRNLLNTLVSDYVYTSHLKFSHPNDLYLEPIEEFMMGALLRTVPLAEGLRAVCLFGSAIYMRHEVETHKKIEAQHSQKQILRIRFEEWGADFNKTANSFYQHLLPNLKKKEIHQLVAEASQFDLNNPDRPDTSLENQHVSGDVDVTNARRGVKQLLEQKEPCVMQLEQWQQEMGYPSYPECCPEIATS